MTTAVLALLACGPSEDQIIDPVDTVDTAPVVEERDPRFDALAAAMRSDLARNGTHGASVAVWEDGEVVYAEGFGSARSDSDVPVDTETLFQIGSTTKFQTAIALLQKVEDGDVALDDTLDATVPGLEFTLGEDWDDQVQMQHLLSHQGGFYDWLDWSQGPDDALLQDYSLGTFAQYLWLMNTPGSFWNYSNPNFVMAGLVTELNDTRAWPDIVVEDVYRALGMERSQMRREAVEQDGNYALGSGFVNLETGAQGDITDLSQIPDPGWARPAGLGWSTPTEMMALAEFLVDGDPSVLSDALRQQLTSPQVDLELMPDGAEVHYGYGMFLHPGFTIGDHYYPWPMWEHGGNTLHFTSSFSVLPEQRFAISILSSGYGDNFGDSLATALETLLELPEPGAVAEYAFDPDGLDRHVGHYIDANNVGDIFIEREGDILTVSMPYLDELGYTVERELVPASTDIWYLNIDGGWYDLTFLGEGEGDSQWLRNRAFVGTRVSDAAPPVARTPLRGAIDDALRSATGPMGPLRQSDGTR